MSPRGRASHGVTQSRYPALVSTPESVFWTWRHPGTSSVPWPDVDGFRKLLTPGHLLWGQEGFATDSSWTTTAHYHCMGVALAPHRHQGAPLGSTVLDPPSWKPPQRRITSP